MTARKLFIISTLCLVVLIGYQVFLTRIGIPTFFQLTPVAAKYIKYYVAPILLTFLLLLFLGAWRKPTTTPVKFMAAAACLVIPYFSNALLLLFVCIFFSTCI